jgi:hypothetical protein
VAVSPELYGPYHAPSTARQVVILSVKVTASVAGLRAYMPPHQSPL